MDLQPVSGGRIETIQICLQLFQMFQHALVCDLRSHVIMHVSITCCNALAAGAERVGRCEQAAAASWVQTCQLCRSNREQEPCR